ncbi:ABC transporter permease [Nakamurella silvestris]|nr:ABC transporter permease [Nakamurella silvestris]
MRKANTRAILLGIAAPLGALVVAAVLTAIILLLSGFNPLDTFRAFTDAVKAPRTLVNTANLMAGYYLSAVAVAIGFKMNLFNIGVEGQYKLAAMLAGAFAGSSLASNLPGPLRIVLTILVAALVGAIWSGIAGLLKVTRGVSEVISTIMLNAIALSIIAYLILPSNLGVEVGTQRVRQTRPITEGGFLEGWTVAGSSSPLYSTLVLALLVGVIYAILLNRTVFGFTLKATGLSETAAVASGVNVKRMTITTMLMSGAIAGIVGIPQLLNGSDHAFSAQNFPGAIGFTGIAIALLGRNHPIGIALAAALWSILDASSNQIQAIAKVPLEIVQIVQGIMVFSVVIAYELVRRYRLVAEQRAVGSALGNLKAPTTPAKAQS